MHDNFVRFKWKWYRRLKYFKFFWFDNYEFDHVYFIKLMILKLTFMGLQFAKFGVIIDEDRKEQVKTIWLARKYLKKYLNSFEELEKLASKKFKEKYGFEYSSSMEMIECPNKLIMETIEHPYKLTKVRFRLETPFSMSLIEEEKAQDYYYSFCNGEKIYELEQEYLLKAFKIIQEKLSFWWD
jgi:hypothetical protein